MCTCTRCCCCCCCLLAWLGLACPITSAHKPLVPHCTVRTVGYSNGKALSSKLSRDVSWRWAALEFKPDVPSSKHGQTPTISKYHRLHTRACTSLPPQILYTSHVASLPPCPDSAWGCYRGLRSWRTRCNQADLNANSVYRVHRIN